MPIIGGAHDQALIIRMFNDRDPAGGNAVDARDVPGPKWQTLRANNSEVRLMWANHCFLGSAR
jgi:hypothetical protein